MGYSLECYALDHRELQTLIGSGRRDVVSRVLEADPFLTSPGVPWRAALMQLVCGVRGRALAMNAAVAHEAIARATDEESVAMAALIRSTGTRLGELVHNSLATDKFRTLFNPAFSPPQFVQPELAPLLLQRPLGFLVSETYPRWGGLARDEIARITGGHTTPGDALADRDLLEWMHSLFDILVDARQRGADLVTLHL